MHRAFGALFELQGCSYEQTSPVTQPSIAALLMQLLSPLLQVKTKLHIMRNVLDTDDTSIVAAVEHLQHKPTLMFRILEELVESCLETRTASSIETLRLFLQIFNVSAEGLLERSCLTDVILRRCIEGLSLPQALLMLSNPRCGLKENRALSDRLEAVTQSLKDEGSHLKALPVRSSDKPYTVIKALQEGLGVELWDCKSNLLDEMTSSYRLVSLTLHQPGSQHSLDTLLLQNDSHRKLRAVQHSDASCGGSSESVPISLARVFPSGHLLAYLGSDWRFKLNSMEAAVAQAFPVSSRVKEASLRLGSWAVVSREHLQNIDVEELALFTFARGAVVEINTRKQRARLYFPDYGVLATADIASLREAPERGIVSPPLLTFCRIQGVAPASVPSLPGEAIQCCALLINPATVGALLPSPANIATLLALASSEEPDIRVSSLRILVQMSRNRKCLAMLNKRHEKGPEPLSISLLCPAIIRLLQQESDAMSEEEINICSQILFNVLNVVKPEYLRSVLVPDVLEMLEKIKDDRCQSEKEKELVDALLLLPRMGNAYQVRLRRHQEIKHPASSSLQRPREAGHTKCDVSFGHPAPGDKAGYLPSRDASAGLSPAVDVGDLSLGADIGGLPPDVTSEGSRPIIHAGGIPSFGKTGHPPQIGAFEYPRHGIDVAELPPDGDTGGLTSDKNICNWTPCGLKERKGKKEDWCEMIMLYSDSTREPKQTIDIGAEYSAKLRGEIVNKPKVPVYDFQSEIRLATKSERTACPDVGAGNVGAAAKVCSGVAEKQLAGKTVSCPDQLVASGEAVVIENDLTLVDSSLCGGSEQNTNVQAVQGDGITEDIADCLQLKTVIDQEVIGRQPALPQNAVLQARPSCKVEMMKSLEINRTVFAESLAPHMAAMLNTGGGTIYIGVTDAGLITGVPANSQKRENVVDAVDLTLTQLIAPRVSPRLVHVSFLPVLTSLRKVDELFVIKISLKSGHGEEYVTHNIPGEEERVYRRRMQGPPFTFRVSR